MKHIYEQPELSKMEYAVSDLISTSGEENPITLFAYDNEATLNWQ